MEATLPADQSSYRPPWRLMVGGGLVIFMLIPIVWLAVTGKLPAPTSVDGFKEFVNALSVPEISLSFFFTPLFIACFVFYKEWTQPKVAAPLLLLFCILYFGSMAIDHDYFLILQKPDNVPISMMMLGTGITLWWGLRQAAINDERIRKGQPLLEEGKDDKVLVWPDLVYTELICIVIGSAILVLWSVVLRAPLEAPANPAGPPNPSKAPWYFLGLQEMLVYFDPWMAGVILPGMIITGLIAMPYCDTNSQRPFIILNWMVGFLVLWVVLIVFGTFLRGPNWNFFGPYQAWDAQFQPAMTNINMSDYFWNSKGLVGFGLGMNLPENMWIREAPGILFTIAWCFVLPVVLARTVMRRMYQQMGAIRFYIMAIHFVVMAMMPLKMVLRWTLTLKYFIYLPEFNFNL